MKLLDMFKKKGAEKQATIRLPAACSAQPPVNAARIVNPEGGWEPKGFDASHRYVVLSRKTGLIVEFEPADLNPKTIRAVVGARYCEKHYRVEDPTSKGAQVDYHALAEDIVTRCDEAGMFSPDSVVSTGLYLNGDRLMVHYGDEVRMDDGTPVDLTPTPSRVFTAGAPLDFTHETPCATQADVEQFQTALKSFTVNSPGGHKLLVGNFVTAALGSVLSCRPIVEVTAERGSGKTTLVDLNCLLLGAQAVRRDGIPSVAQVLYELEHQQRTVFCDEVEARADNRKKFEALAELGRAGFNNASRPTFTRVIGGRTRSFNAPSGLWLCGISIPGLNPATESRLIRIRMGALSEQAAVCRHPLLNPDNRKEVIELGKRLRRLLITRVPVLRATERVLREQLLARGQEARIAEKFAVVLAGHFALTRDTVPALEEVAAIISEVGLNEVERADAASTDSELCLDTLLAGQVTVYREVAGRQLKVSQAIGDVVSSIITSRPEERISLGRQLEEFGVRVEQKHDKWKLMVSGFLNHQRLKSLFRGTDWSLGGWKAPLLRLAGAEETVQRFGVSSRPQRAVMLDVPEYLMDAGALAEQ